MPQSSRPHSPESGTPPISPRMVSASRVVAAALLLAPFVAMLWVPSYSRDSPRLGGVPFFFWYQALWVLLTAACMYIAYVLLRRDRRRRAAAERMDGGEPNRPRPPGPGGPGGR